MPVNSTHPQYDAHIALWKKCRDVMDGSETIKLRGTDYLPILSGMTTDEYNAYKNRALFYGMTAKTVSALVGMSTAREPLLKYPEDMSQYFKDANGLQFLELLGTTLSDLLLIGRIGHLVDAPTDGGDLYVTTYRAENILNWDIDEYGNITWCMLTEEVVTADENDRFVKVVSTQYRELGLDADGNYVVNLYNEKLESIDTIEPTFKGNRLNYVPFYIANPYGISADVVRPPMMDIVNINISHYMTSADLEHGRHFTGLPTPVAIGVDAATVLKVGSMTAWNLPDNGDAKYLEFTGQGLQSLENALKEKETQLASMSARFIDNSTRGSEAVDVVRMRFMSETASLAINAKSAESLCTKSYRTIANIGGMNEDDMVISLNVDFMAGKLSGQEIESLVKSYVEGGITVEVLIHNLRRGEIIPPTMTDEDIIKNLKPATSGTLQ